MLDWIRSWPEWLEGREGEADPPGQAPNPAGLEPEGDEDEDDAGDGKVPSEVKKLRREAAALRQRTKAAEAERDQLKAANLSDFDKERLARTSAEAERDLLRKAQREDRIAYAVRAKAVELSFHDPEDAVSLLNLDAIEVGDDGRPDGRSVKAAVDKLVKDRPHLVKQPAPGGGDGGAKTPPTPKTFDDAVKAREEILLRQGLGLVRIEQ
jgi:hypothetical protein